MSEQIDSKTDKKDKGVFNTESREGGRGHWTVNYTGTQSFITTLSYSLAQKLLGTFIEVCFKTCNQ